MAVTPIGTNTVTALSRRLILPRITDNVYNSNVMFFRWYHANKFAQQGGTQIEQPLMYSRMAAGGSYTGYQLLNVTPTDSIQNAAWAWKQYFSPVTVDGLTLLRADSPLAIADYIATQFKQSEMDLADNLGTGLWQGLGGTDTDMDGIIEAVDAGGVGTTYGGIAHSGNTWWQSQIDSSTTTLSLSAMQSMWGSCQSGGRAPTIIASTQSNYNRYWNLNLAPQQYPVQPGGKDMQLAQAGFENLLFNGAPFVTDSHIPTTGTASSTGANNIFFLNEDYVQMVVATRADFHLQDFQTPTNQDAMTALLLWAGNLVFSNIQRQGKMTAVTA
jgi:hypothetical protein